MTQKSLISMIAGAMAILLFSVFTAQAATSPDGNDLFKNLFGYGAVRYDTLDDLPEWLRVLRRHPPEDLSKTDPLTIWEEQLDKAASAPAPQQMKLINLFANRHPYLQDIDNYGVDDYWAIVREFLKNNGDCEDYAITKFFSLRQLGFPEDSVRIVILQDTNLGIAHAVVAVALDGDIFILDNQVDAVLSHHDIRHYTPLFSVSEHHWWLHVPSNFFTGRG